MWQPPPPPPFLDKLPRPILPYPIFSRKNFQTPPFPLTLKKSDPPPFVKGWGEGGEEGIPKVKADLDLHCIT